MSAPIPINPLIRPTQNPQTRWAPGAPAIAPPGALRGPNPLAAPQAPVSPQPMPEAFPRSRYGLEHRVSTRIPTSAKLTYDPHERSDLVINRASMLPQGTGAHHFEAGAHEKAQTNIGASMAKHADLIRNEYPSVNSSGRSHGAVFESMIQHGHDNIVALWNKIRNEPWVEKAAQWYWGANRMAAEMGQRYGLSHRQAAGVIASLSPQKDWDQNVSLAERAMDTHRNRQDVAVTPQMMEKIEKVIGTRRATTVDQLRQYLRAGKDEDNNIEWQPLAEGVRYRDLAHPVQKAMFIRAWDEAHSPNRGYDIVSPTGERTRARIGTGAGEHDDVVRWNPVGNIANAVRVMESNDHLPTISRALGVRHKVRNFYNNIISPDAGAFMRAHDGGDITADTHAINVALMHPMGGSHKKVAEGLGAAGPAFTGAQGLYGLHADAYRRAARTISKQEGRRFLPREVQSATWEAIRGLFEKHHKATDAEGNPTHPVGIAARDAGYAVRHGFMRPEHALDAIIRVASGGGIGAGRIKPPRWHQPRPVEEE